MLLDRLFDLFAIGQQANVGRGLVQALRDPAERVQQLRVHFSWIGLTGDGIGLFESHFVGDLALQLPDFGVVASEELKKAGLGSRGSLGTSGAERLQPVLDFLQVQNEVVRPQATSFSDRRRLGGLQVGKSEAGQVAVLGRKGPHCIDGGRQTSRHQFECIAYQDDVGIVGDEAAGGPQVNNRFCVGALVAVRFDVGHDVMTSNSLVFLGDIQVQIGLKFAELVQLSV